MVSRPSPNATVRFKPLLRYGLWGALFLLALGLGFGIPVAMVLDREVRAEFEALTWQIPTRVFARPLALVEGEPMSVAALQQELEPMQPGMKRESFVWLYENVGAAKAPASPR